MKKFGKLLASVMAVTMMATAGVSIGAGAEEISNNAVESSVLSNGDYFKFDKQTRMDSSGGFTFDLQHSLYSDKFYINSSAISITANPRNERRAYYGPLDWTYSTMSISLYEDTFFDRFIMTQVYTVDGGSQTHTFSGLDPSKKYYLRISCSPQSDIGRNVSVQGYGNVNGFSMLG